MMGLTLAYLRAVPWFAETGSWVGCLRKGMCGYSGSSITQPKGSNDRGVSGSAVIVYGSG